MTDTATPAEVLRCPNCQEPYPLKAHYCSNCGQDTHTHKLPFRHFVMEYLESTLHLDDKILPTLKALLINPGSMIRNYNQNRRARYVPPIRLYIFISFIYFLMVGSGVNRNVEAFASEFRQERFDLKRPVSLNLFTRSVITQPVLNELSATPHLTPGKTGDILKSHQVNTDAFNNTFITRLVQIRTGQISPEELGHQILSGISKMVFLLMPVFAFLLWLFCGRGKMYYSEALVFSLYFHSFYFILLTLGWILGLFLKFSELYSYVFMLACVYLFISIRTAFNKRWGRALLQAFLLIFSYAVIFGMAFILAILTSIVV